MLKVKRIISVFALILLCCCSFPVFAYNGSNVDVMPSTSSYFISRIEPFKNYIIWSEVQIISNRSYTNTVIAVFDDYTINNNIVNASEAHIFRQYRDNLGSSYYADSTENLTLTVNAESYVYSNLQLGGDIYDYSEQILSTISVYIVAVSLIIYLFWLFRLCR